MDMLVIGRTRERVMSAIGAWARVPTAVWRHRGASWIRWWVRRARPHAVGLLGVVLAFCLGQIITLLQKPTVFIYPDTFQYITAAQRILITHVVFDPYRTPGYPALLALIFAVRYDTFLNWVVAVQAALLLIAAVEIYILAYRLSRSRWIATLASVLVAGNLYVLQWDRLVLTEALATFLLVTLIFALERHLWTGSTASLAACFGLCALAMVTRPNFLYLPLVLLLAIGWKRLRGGELRRSLPRLTLLCGAVYGVVLICIVGNGITYRYFGLSAVSNYSLLGKVMELHVKQHMPLTGFDPQFAQLNASVEQFTQKGDYQGWGWVWKHPEYSDHYGAQFGTYASQVLRHHPGEYIKQTLIDIVQAWLAAPRTWAPYSYSPAPIHLLLDVCGRMIALAYWLLPCLLLILGWRVWRRPHDTAALTALAILVAVAGNIVFTAATDYNEFDRIRAPLDWGMLVVATISLSQGACLAVRAAQRRWQTRHCHALLPDHMHSRPMT